MTRMILVPIKEPTRAKSRLSSLMTGEERTAVAWAMFEDLISALQPLPYPVTLVSDSERAAERATMLGWRVILEERQTSESASVDFASSILASEGIRAVLRLPADIPLAEPCDVAELFAASAPGPSAVLVPSFDRRGTNALLRTPPCLFPSRFGLDSFALHLRAAAEMGVSVRIVENPRLALDIDNPADVTRFLAQASDRATYRVLMNLDIRERLSRHDVQHDSHSRIAGNS